MFGPFVVPECGGVSAVRKPVFVHVFEGCGGVGGEDLGEVGVGGGGMAELGVGAIAVVWPGWLLVGFLYVMASMLCLGDMSERTNHNPCRVQLSAGPIDGFVSQN